MYILYLARVTTLTEYSRLYVKYSSCLQEQSEEVSVLLPIEKVAQIEAPFKKPAYKALVQQGL